MELFDRQYLRRGYWYFALALGLSIYFSQTLHEMDYLGQIDGVSIALLSLFIVFASSLFGSVIASGFAILLVLSNILLVVGNRFYFDFYQSFTPFSLLSLAPESLSLIRTLPFGYVISAGLGALVVSFLLVRIIRAVQFPGRRSLLLMAFVSLSSGLMLQIYHDGRGNKQFSAYSEVPTGYFLRSGGLIPFIVGSPFSERLVEINTLADRILRGKVQRLPESMQQAVDAFYPDRRSENELYPFYPGGRNPAPGLTDTASKRKNVIILVLESFRASESKLNRTKKSATPFLDNLKDRSLWAENFYSTVPLTLSSEMAIHCGAQDYFGSETLSSGQSFKLTCLPELLRAKGYETIWFHGNTKKFYDRVNQLPKMGFNKLYGIEDLYGAQYDRSRIENMRSSSDQQPVLGWGMPDPLLFNTALDKLTATRKPFYAEILSVSNHLPFNYDWGIDFPPYLQAQDTFYDKYRRGLYYTDQAVKGFVEAFNRSPLYDNTILVITGDHGIWTFDKQAGYSNINKREQFFRVPLLIYGKNIKPSVIESPASHIDIAPTLLSLLGMANNAAFMGRSLVDEPDKIVPVLTMLEASYGVRLGDKVCAPANRCFHNGDEACDGQKIEWTEQSTMTCYKIDDNMMFDPNPEQVSMPEDTLENFDNLLNYMLLGLKTGFKPDA